MMAGLLRRHLGELGIEAVVDSAGLKPGGEPAMDRAVRLLADIGIDVSAHLSRRLSDDDVAAADLILTAERDHVVSIAGMWPTAFRHTFTLPEAAALARSTGGRGGAPVEEWLDRLGVGRPTGLDYFDAPQIDQIEDPTGLSPAVWSRVFSEIDVMTAAVAEALA